MLAPQWDCNSQHKENQTDQTDKLRVWPDGGGRFNSGNDQHLVLSAPNSNFYQSWNHPLVFDKLCHKWKLTKEKLSVISTRPQDVMRIHQIVVDMTNGNKNEPYGGASGKKT